MSTSRSPRVSGRQHRYVLHTRITTQYTEERPDGVAALVAIHILATVVMLIWLLLLTLILPVPLAIGGTGDDPAGLAGSVQSMLDERFHTEWLLQICVALVVIPLALATGIGLWRLKNWARTLSIALYGLIIALYVASNSGPIIGLSLSIPLMSGVAIYYLLRPDIREAFRDRPEF